MIEVLSSAIKDLEIRVDLCSSCILNAATDVKPQVGTCNICSTGCALFQGVAFTSFYRQVSKKVVFLQTVSKAAKRDLFLEQIAVQSNFYICGLLFSRNCYRLKD